MLSFSGYITKIESFLEGKGIYTSVLKRELWIRNAKKLVNVQEEKAKKELEEEFKDTDIGRMDMYETARFRLIANRTFYVIRIWDS